MCRDLCLMIFLILISACQREVDGSSDNEAVGGIYHSGVYVRNDTSNNFEDAQNYLIHFPENLGHQSYELFSYGQNFDVRFIDSEGNWHLIDDEYCDWLSIELQDNVKSTYIDDNRNERHSGFVRTMMIEWTSNVAPANRTVTLLVTSSFEDIWYGAELTIEQDGSHTF